jgi:glycosyltransferase involved in cell wall biosynthesis
MKKIAILVSDLSIQNGISVMAKFLYDEISRSGRFEADLFSLSTSARDANSVRILQPSSWIKGLQISNHQYETIPYRHIGANFTEIEFFRYRPRQILNEILKSYDLVQIVAGLPMGALVANEFKGKVALALASITESERQSMIACAPEPRKTYLKVMSKINKRLEKQAFDRADVILVINQWLTQYINKTHPGKAVFAPPGVDTDFFRQKDYRENGYILSVGRFQDRRKNVAMLFRAYKSLLEKNEHAPRLVIAGQNAPLENDMQIACELGISEKIDVFTELSKERLREMYRDAALFVLSSTEEGFGIVIAEAMACGLPVVATRCGGPEVLLEENHNGFLVPVNDAKQMAEKIFELLNDPKKRRQFGETNRKKAVENFSLSATGKIYLETYDKLLSCGR